VQAQGASVHIFDPALDVDGALPGIDEIPVRKLTGEEGSREYYQSAPAQEAASGQRIPYHCQSAGSKTDGGMSQGKYCTIAVTFHI